MIWLLLFLMFCLYLIIILQQTAYRCIQSCALIRYLVLFSMQTIRFISKKHLPDTSIDLKLAYIGIMTFVFDQTFLIFLNHIGYQKLFHDFFFNKAYSFWNFKIPNELYTLNQNSESLIFCQLCQNPLENEHHNSILLSCGDRYHLECIEKYENLRVQNGTAEKYGFVCTACNFNYGWTNKFLYENPLWNRETLTTFIENTLLDPEDLPNDILQFLLTC